LRRFPRSEPRNPHGDVVRLDYRKDAEPGQRIDLDQVLLVGAGADVRIGMPTVAGASVAAVVRGQVRGKKLVVYTYKRRKNYHRKKGHRQHYTEVRVESIQQGDA
jgi:large subunit ribosomal protein L21